MDWIMIDFVNRIET